MFLLGPRGFWSLCVAYALRYGIAFALAGEAFFIFGITVSNPTEPLGYYIFYSVVALPVWGAFGVCAGLLGGLVAAFLHRPIASSVPFQGKVGKVGGKSGTGYDFLLKPGCGGLLGTPRSFRIQLAPERSLQSPDKALATQRTTACRRLPQLGHLRRLFVSGPSQHLPPVVVRTHLPPQLRIHQTPSILPLDVSSRARPLVLGGYGLSLK